MVRAFDQALACLRAPDTLAAVRLQPLPEELTALLRLVAGESEAMSEAVRQTGAAPAVMHEAASLYLQQLLFAGDGDSYRVLGVRADATAEQIKQHHRWLVRWLHPDRNPDGWEATYVNRVNAAWQDLRNPERRRTFDQGRGVPGHHPDQAPRSAVQQRDRVRDAPRARPLLSPRMVKSLPAMVMGGLAAVAVVGLLLLYTQQPEYHDVDAVTAPDMSPEEQPGWLAADSGEMRDVDDAGAAASAAVDTASNAPVFASVRLVPPVAASAAQPVVPEPRSSDSVVAAPTPRSLRQVPAAAPTAPHAPAAPRAGQTPGLAPAVPAPAAVAPHQAVPALAAVAPPSTMPVPATRREHAPLADPGQAAIAVEAAREPIPAAQGTSPATIAASAPPPVAAATPVAPLSAPPTAGPAEPSPAPTSTTSPRVIDQESAAAIVAGFTRAYEAGNVEALGAMFSHDSRAARNAREDMLREYRRLFRTSNQRRMEISGITWVARGDTATIFASFDARIKSPGRRSERQIRGDIRFDLRREEGELRITDLRHESHRG